MVNLKSSKLLPSSLRSTASPASLNLGLAKTSPVEYFSGALKRPAVFTCQLLGYVWFAIFITRQIMGSHTMMLPYKSFTYTNSDAPPPVPLASESLGQTVTDKAAFIVETQYTPNLVPLILHFHGVLGPAWPIVFYTTQSLIDTHLAPPLAANATSPWHAAVASGAIATRVIPEHFDFSTRVGVNLFLVDRWLWEGLAPATSVLMFQSDSMVCANSPHRAEDFLQYDMIGPPPLQDRLWYHGGLTLRNRTLMMEILDAPHDWMGETQAGKQGGGEDIFFAEKMKERGARLPDWSLAVRFAVEFDWNWEAWKTPFGLHKVQTDAKGSLDEIRRYCPEVALAVPGTLEPPPPGEESWDDIWEWV